MSSIQGMVQIMQNSWSQNIIEERIPEWACVGAKTVTSLITEYTKHVYPIVNLHCSVKKTLHKKYQQWSYSILHKKIWDIKVKCVNNR